MRLLAYSRVLQQLANYSLYWKYKTTVIIRHWYKFSYRHNAICKIDLNLGKYIIDNDYETISTIYKKSENRYYLVKWTSDSYIFQSSHKIGRYIIKDGE